MLIGNDFTGHTVIVYDEDYIKITETNIIEYDIVLGNIRIRENSKLATGDNVQLLILTSPNPCSFHGRVGPRIQGMSTIDLHSGKSKEDRASKRFPIESIDSIVSTGVIDGLVRGNEAIDMPPVNVQLVNISQGGIRFSGAKGLLQNKDEVLLSVNIKGAVKILAVEVVNILNAHPGRSDYCGKFTIADRANPEE